MAPAPDHDPAADRTPSGAPSPRAQPLHPLTLIVLVVGLLVVAAAALGSRALHREAVDRLLRQRANEAGASLTVTVGGIHVPLAAGARVAEATDGDPAAFERLMASQVGPAAPFAAAALWEGSSGEPLAVVGTPDQDLRAQEPVRELLDRAVAAPTFTVVDLRDGPVPRIGYAASVGAGEGRYVAYAESALPEDPTTSRRDDEAFADLDYAVYLGDTEADQALLAASTPDLPIAGDRASTVVSLGDTRMRLVVTPRGALIGGLSENLAWIVAAVGALIVLGIALLTERLLRRRDEAVALAAAVTRSAEENERLFREQVVIAETLQRSLLPERLPSPPGVAVAARYWPAGSAGMVGGDFYDLFPLSDERWGIVIGDVCGKGIQAAALTGQARHTVRTAARQLTSPAQVLRWVHEGMVGQDDELFCTVCFGVLRLDGAGGARLDLALGGHPPPLLCRADGTVETVGEHGTLLGLVEPCLVDTTTSLRPGDTLVLYTDGLTDAPGDQAVPIEEVSAMLAADPARRPDAVADEIRRLKRRRRPTGSGDDTAVMVLQLATPTATDDVDDDAAAADVEPAALGSRAS